MRCERGLDDGRCKWPEAGIIGAGDYYTGHGGFLSVGGVWACVMGSLNVIIAFVFV